MQKHKDGILKGLILIVILNIAIFSPIVVKAETKQCRLNSRKLIQKYNINLTKKSANNEKKYVISAKLQNGETCNSKDNKCVLKISVGDDNLGTLTLTPGKEEEKVIAIKKDYWIEEPDYKKLTITLTTDTDSVCDKAEFQKVITKDGDEFEREVAGVNIPDDETIAESSQTINCDNYETKFAEKPFKYAFCKVASIAKANGNVKTLSTDKFGAQTQKLYCDYKVDPDKVKTGDKASYYLNNTSFYASHTTTKDKLGNYEYHYDPNNPTQGEAIKCKITCEEAVSVEYGPPVASKAGLCFEYKVKVTSRVSCGMTEKPNKPATTNSRICLPYPSCSGTNASGVSYGGLHEGGPSEDFDQCIAECDGGKYTEKCSKKCYNKIYGTTTNTQLSLTEDASTRRLANNTPDVYNLTQCVINNSAKVGQPGFYGHGCYYRSGGAILFKPAYGGAFGTWYHYNAHKNYSAYAPDSIGIFRHQYGNGTQCQDYCVWQGCGDSNVYLNQADIDYDNAKNAEKYKNAIAACKLEASCNTTTTEYTIAVKYDTKNKDGGIDTTKIWFPYSKNPSKVTLKSKENGSVDNGEPKTILDYAGCYKNSDEKNWYQTEWSFPGTWIHNKTHEISYEDRTGTSDWKKEPLKFCAPLNAQNVNTEWYDCYNTYKKSNKTAADKESLMACYNKLEKATENTLYKKNSFNNERTSNGYNIQATTRKFGYFEWNFNINCFYALNATASTCENPPCSPSSGSNPNKPVTPGDPGCPGEKCTIINSGEGYTIRSVELENLFPNSTQRRETGNATKTREIGFNWTSAATINDRKNKNYAINPERLKERIQTAGDSIYSKDKESTYLEYRFELTPKILAEIRANTKNNKSYTAFNGKTDSNTGAVTTYTSDLFRGKSWATVYTKLGCNNKTCSTQEGE